MLIDVRPMLVGRGAPTGDLSGWAVEPKLDGWRGRVNVDPSLPGGLRARTRHGHNVTDVLPELQPLAALGQRLLLDGEFVVGSGRGNDFYALTPRMASRPPHRISVTFCAFDLLCLDGEPLVHLPYIERRRALEALDLGLGCRIVPRFPACDHAALLAAGEHEDLEGVVYKRLASPYLPGERCATWRKVKTQRWRREHALRRLPPAARAAGLPA